MLGVLLESSARRQRRTGGAALSVAAHLAIVGAVTAFTVPRPPVKRTPIEVVPVTLVKDAPPTPREQRPRTPSAPHVGPFSRLIDIQIPTPAIPAAMQFDGTQIPAPNDIIPSVVGGGPTDARGKLGRLDFGDDSTDAREWRGNEALMRVITQGKPRYPESLRQAAIEGRVLVQFKVDTLGRIDPASVTIISSAHELFSRAVRDALSGFRFRPAEVNGRRVVALAEMPFEFSIRR